MRFPSRAATCERAAAGLAFSILIAASSAAHGGATPHGGEFQVNTVTTDSQYLADVGVDAGGEFVVVWTSFAASGADTEGGSIWATRLGRNGLRLGGELLINEQTGDDQIDATVSRLPGGEFVVAWTSYAHAGADVDSGAIALRRFGATGAPAASEVEVNTATLDMQRRADVAFDPLLGTFVVTWEDLGDNSIQARHYLADGEASGPSFPVSGEGSNSRADARVASLGQDEYLIVWEEYASEGDDDWSVRGRRIAGGAAAGEPFLVNSYTTGNQDDPAVGGNGDGVAVVVWASGGSTGTDTSGSSLQARRFDATGPLAGEFQVNDWTTGNQSGATVDVDSRGHFVVAWYSESSPGSDTSGLSIQARQFRAGGEPVGAQFQVNTTTTDQQATPSVAVDPRGDFAVTWDSGVSAGDDTSGSSIQGRLFDDVFRDDFEAGDWARWSGAVS